MWILYRDLIDWQTSIWTPIDKRVTTVYYDFTFFVKLYAVYKHKETTNDLKKNNFTTARQAMKKQTLMQHKLYLSYSWDHFIAINRQKIILQLNKNQLQELSVNEVQIKFMQIVNSLRITPVKIFFHFTFNVRTESVVVFASVFFFTSWI